MHAGRLGLAPIVLCASTVLLFGACDRADDAEPAPQRSTAPSEDQVAIATPVPSNDGGAERRATVRAERGATPAATATATVEAMPTATVRSADGTPTPWTVTITLEEAAATIEAWFGLPELEGRVDRAYFATHEELTTRLAAAGFATIEMSNGGKFDTIDSDDARHDALLKPGLLAIVEGSHLAVHNSCTPYHANSPRPCGVWLGEPRQRFIVLFDARDRYLRYGIDEGRPETVFMLHPKDELHVASGLTWPDQVSQALIEIEPDTRQEATSIPDAKDASPVASAMPTTRPDTAPFERLALGQVPASLAELASDWPLVKGARWRYRTLETRNWVVMDAGVCEVRVDDVYRPEPDSVVARYADTEGPCLDLPDTRLSPHGLDTCLDVPVGELDAELAALDEVGSSSRCAYKSDRVPLDLIEALPVASEPTCEQRALVTFCRGESVDTPAGRFEDCVSVQDEGMNLEVIWWYCPGVGLVRYQMKGSWLPTSYMTTVDLVDYEIPPMVPVP